VKEPEVEYVSLEALIGKLREADEEAFEARHQAEKKKLAELRKRRGEGISGGELIGQLEEEVLQDPSEKYAKERDAIESKRREAVENARRDGKIPPPPTRPR